MKTKLTILFFSVIGLASVAWAVDFDMKHKRVRLEVFENGAVRVEISMDSRMDLEFVTKDREEFLAAMGQVFDCRRCVENVPKKQKKIRAEQEPGICGILGHPFCMQ